MRVLVTGSSGYIGNRLANLLADCGHEVVGLDRRPADSKNRLTAFIETDLLRTNEHRGWLDGVETVFHLAAAKADWGLTEADYQRDNVEATTALVDMVGDRVSTWIYMSTVGVYGPSAVPLTESANPAPINAYARSKLDAERIFEQIARGNGDAAIGILRPSAVFGPGNPPTTNVFRLTDAIYRRRFVMVGDGRTAKTTSFITNTIAATVFLADLVRSAPNRYPLIFNYVDEPLISTGEMVSLLRAELGRTGMEFRLPLAIARPAARVADLVADVTGVDLPITSARISKFCTATAYDASAIRATGFCQPVGLREAIAHTIDDYFTHYSIHRPIHSRGRAG